MHRSERSNFNKRVPVQDSTFFVLMKNLAKQLILVAQTFPSSTTLEERLSNNRSSLTSESESFGEDLPIRHSPVKSHFFHLIFSYSSELEESSLEKSKSLKAAHTQDMIFWNFFLSPKWFFFLVITLVAGVIPIGIVVLIGGVKLLPLRAISDEVSGVITLKAAPERSPLLAKLVQGTELPRRQSNLLIGDALILLIRSYSKRRQSKLQRR
jgi:hypothetical protein